MKSYIFAVCGKQVNQCDFWLKSNVSSNTIAQFVVFYICYMRSIGLFNFICNRASCMNPTCSCVGSVDTMLLCFFLIIMLKDVLTVYALLQNVINIML